MAGTPLTGSTAASTYDALLKITDNGPVGGTLKTVTDGLGNDSALQVSSAGVKSTGTLDVAGAVTLTTALPLTGGGTGSTTASAARTALGLGDMATQTASSVAITGGSVTGITDVAIADGGTGSSTAAGARTNLGVTATGADTTYAFRANNLSDLASASTSRTNLGLGTIATQASSAVSISGGSITGITDLAVADGGTGSSTAAGARTNMGLGTISTQDSSSVTITGGSVTGITDITVADGGTGSSTASGARSNLGLFPTTTNSDYAGSFAINQAGSMNADLVFNTTGAPTVSLAAGTWLITGSVTARTSDFDDEVWAQFYNNEEATAFGGSSVKDSSFHRGPLFVTAIVTLAGTRTIYFKVFRTANVTLDVGSAGGPAGYISAQRLF